MRFRTCRFIRVSSMAYGLRRWRWGFRLGQPFFRLVPPCGSCRWRFSGMNEGRQSQAISLFWEEFGARFARSSVERPVGRTRGFPRAWLAICPPQAVENGKIRSVLAGLPSGRFWAGTSLAKMGNTLGHLRQCNVMQRTARRLHKEHLIR